MKFIIERPIITEKSLFLASKGLYTFKVSEMARKEDIIVALKKSYHVDVVEIKTMIMHGKIRRVGRKMNQVVVSDWKKAIVRLKSGQKLDLFEITPQPGVEETKPEAKK